jgi:Maltose operon periplasmic protein precursor (MalM).
MLASCLTACEMVAPVFDTSKPLTVSEGQSELQGSAACCNSLSELPFIDITKDSNEDYKFDRTAPAFQFSTGKSFVRAFRLPLNVDAMSIEIDAAIKDSVFVPTVDFYNSSMVLIKRMQPAEFVYKPARFVQGDVLEGRFMVTNLTAAEDKKIAFMVIYTTDAVMQDKTKIIHPAKLFAMANGTVPPDIPDPLIPHAPTGTVNIKFTMNNPGQNLLSSLDGPLVGESAPAATVQSNAADKTVVLATPGQATTQTVTVGTVATSTTVAAAVAAPQAAPATSAVSPSSATMLPETESLYNQLIQKAVASGDIEKAMTLTNEAERAGSRSAKQTFVNAVKSGKK